MHLSWLGHTFILTGRYLYPDREIPLSWLGDTFILTGRCRYPDWDIPLSWLGHTFILTEAQFSLQAPIGKPLWLSIIRSTYNKCVFLSCMCTGFRVDLGKINHINVSLMLWLPVASWCGRWYGCLGRHLACARCRNWQAGHNLHFHIRLISKIQQRLVLRSDIIKLLLLFLVLMIQPADLIVESRLFLFQGFLLRHSLLSAVGRIPTILKGTSPLLQHDDLLLSETSQSTIELPHWECYQVMITYWGILRPWFLLDLGNKKYNIDKYYYVTHTH